jgi:hypothetical protein
MLWFMSVILVFTVTAGLASADVGEGIRAGLVAYWPLDEGAGDTAADVIGGHTGMLSGVTWTEDAPTGMALDWDPANDPLMTVADAPDIDDWSGGFTIAHWFRPRAGGSVMDKSGSDAVRIQWYVLGDRRHHWGHGSSFGFSDGNPVPVFDEWYHIAWTHDNSTSLVYRDGEVVGSTEFDGPIPSTGAALYFGNRLVEEGRSEWYDGGQDDIALWNRALSAIELRAIGESASLGALIDATAVEPGGKFATTWGALRREY